ncbi:hypothetical protein BH24ACT19_BH24ACT19_03440 [soil metagenome]
MEGCATSSRSRTRGSRRSGGREPGRVRSSVAPRGGHRAPGFQAGRMTFAPVVGTGGEPAGHQRVHHGAERLHPYYRGFAASPAPEPRHRGSTHLVGGHHPPFSTTTRGRARRPVVREVPGTDRSVGHGVDQDRDAQPRDDQTGVRPRASPCGRTSPAPEGEPLEGGRLSSCRRATRPAVRGDGGARSTGQCGPAPAVRRTRPGGAAVSSCCPGGAPKRRWTWRGVL